MLKMDPKDLFETQRNREHRILRGLSWISVSSGASVFPFLAPLQWEFRLECWMVEDGAMVLGKNRFDFVSLT